MHVRSLSLSAAWVLAPCLFAAPPAAAQSGSAAFAPQAVEPDEQVVTLDIGEQLVRRLNQPWAEAQANLAEPDSGAVQGRGGRLAWRVPGYAVDRFEAEVEDGRIALVALDFSTEGPDFSPYAATLQSRHGRPGRGGFYAAADLDAPFDLAVDADRQRLTFRAVPGRTVPDDTPLPIQFRAAASAPAPPPPDTSRVYEIVDEPVEIVNGIGALMSRVGYPPDALEEGVGGVVFAQFIVNTNGRPSEIVALRSPDPRLSAAAIEAVRQTQFWPGHVGGEPVRTRFTVPVRFVPEAVQATDEDTSDQ